MKAFLQWLVTLNLHTDWDVIPGLAGGKVWVLEDSEDGFLDCSCNYQAPDLLLLDIHKTQHLTPGMITDINL